MRVLRNMNLALVRGKEKVTAGLCGILTKKRKGFDGLVIAVVLVLIAILILVALKTGVFEKIKEILSNISTQLNNINNWTN